MDDRSGLDSDRARLVTIWRSVATAQPTTPCIVSASAATSGGGTATAKTAAAAAADTPTPTRASFGALNASVDALAERLRTLFQRGDGSRGEQVFQRGVGVAVLCEPGGAEATALLASMQSGCPWIPMDANDAGSRRTLVRAMRDA